VIPFPYLSLGDLVVMLDNQGPFQDAGAVLFEVSAAEPIIALPHQAICLTSAAGGPPNAYTMDGNGLTGQQIVAGNLSPRIAPKVLQVDQYQLAEWRVRFSFLNIDAGVAADDFSVQGFTGATPRWSTSNFDGETNAQVQFPDPADAAIAPARGNNQGVPPAVISQDPAEHAPVLWTYFTRFAPGFKLKNNGGATVGANGTFAWLMRATGCVYNVTPYPLGANPQPVILGGERVLIPADVKRTDIKLVQLTRREAKAAPSELAPA